MRIDSKSGPMRLGASKKAREAKRSSGGFQQSVHRVDSVVGTVSTIAGVEPVQGIDSLLAVQQVAENPLDSERDWARHWGGDILSRLSQLRDGLLAGNVPLERLERLTEALEARKEVNEPELKSVIDQIELRARIEIAKLHRDR